MEEYLEHALIHCSHARHFWHGGFLFLFLLVTALALVFLMAAAGSHYLGGVEVTSPGLGKGGGEEGMLTKIGEKASYTQ